MTTFFKNVFCHCLDSLCFQVGFIKGNVALQDAIIGLCYYKNNPRKCFYKLLIRLLFQTIKHYILSCLTIKICHKVCDPKPFTLQSQMIHAWRDLIAVIFPIIIASLRRYFRISMLLFQYSFSLNDLSIFAKLLFLHNIFIIQMYTWEGHCAPQNEKSFLWVPSQETSIFS